jgi:hypothetical protein
MGISWMQILGHIANPRFLPIPFLRPLYLQVQTNRLIKSEYFLSLHSEKIKVFWVFFMQMRPLFQIQIDHPFASKKVFVKSIVLQKINFLCI